MEQNITPFESKVSKVVVLFDVKKNVKNVIIGSGCINAT